LLLFVGLAVAVPVLAHSSWHLYRKVVEPAAPPLYDAKPWNENSTLTHGFQASESVVWQSLFVTSRPPTIAAHFGELAAKAAYGIGKGMEQWH